jgi:hypothetical protein
MVDLGPATAGLEQLQVRPLSKQSISRDDAAKHPRSLVRIPPAHLPLQAAFSKGDLAACKQLLSRLKVNLSAAGVAGLTDHAPVAAPLNLQLFCKLSFVLQLELTKLPALPPTYESSPNAQQQLALASRCSWACIPSWFGLPLSPLALTA